MVRRSEPKVVIPPTDYPITLDEAATFVHLDPSNIDEDQHLEMLIATATDMVEHYASRALLTQTLSFEFMPNPPEIMPMRMPLFRAAPLQGVNFIKAVEQDGTEHVEAANVYNVDTFAIPGRVQLLMGFWWDYYVFGRYRIEYVCGYGAPSDVPAPFKTAIGIMVAQLYQAKEEMDYKIAPQVEVILQDYKLDAFDYTCSGITKWSPFGEGSMGYGLR